MTLEFGIGWGVWLRKVVVSEYPGPNGHVIARDVHHTTACSDQRETNLCLSLRLGDHEQGFSQAQLFPVDDISEANHREGIGPHAPSRRG